jgi:DNA-binding transcriptional ArsR family regulator
MGMHEAFSVLSDPVRREILLCLRNGKLSAGVIASKFRLTGATISYHLARLKEAGLVHETRAKNYVYYELSTTVFDDLLLWLGQFVKGEARCLTDV